MTSIKNPSMDNASNTIASRIHYLRTRIAGLTRTDFAQKLGSKPVNIAILERGIRRPSEKLLNRFQQVYDVNINWLLTGTGNVLIEKI
ncbi:helix-turn-helix transcriptional regulator [Cytophagaceae bacterium DM2B3-1]|uniref:Helix-turn-helix transcriptional regulator n=1 Tax=Xanthocytophaga flava TaxID=3048013 RepID=A0AAE3QKM2_9BACT|nr:helix-turn-helix transcriptional regulator [Xanthocytophaga flavus]MDJ1469096.1 helix-turn-helix transcriptional regulator [Xanthocytophaga flavus]MDJ1481107.1 helix-turn-helix transcriptional regulator [Xanthocytophaga flavus]MDJ1497359.1 helix-turn-helix transcriptional regulator [Xanthocytophaga flavus]